MPRQPEPEAPLHAPLERFAFAGSRRDIEVDEVDTAIEKRLMQSLKRHFVNNVPPDASIVKLIQTFLRNGTYEAVFSPPKEHRVYRGIGCSWSALLKTVGPSATMHLRDEDVNIEDDVYSSKSISSWTTLPEIAREFATMNARSYYFENPGKPAFELIFAADTTRDENRFSFIDATDTEDGGTLMNVRDLRINDYENEVVGLGNIWISSVSWKPYDGWYNDVKSFIVEASPKMKGASASHFDELILEMISDGRIET